MPAGLHLYAHLKLNMWELDVLYLRVTYLGTDSVIETSMVDLWSLLGDTYSGSDCTAKLLCDDLTI